MQRDELFEELVEALKEIQRLSLCPNDPLKKLKLKTICDLTFEVLAKVNS